MSLLELCSVCAPSSAPYVQVFFRSTFLAYLVFTGMARWDPANVTLRVKFLINRKFASIAARVCKGKVPFWGLTETQEGV